MSIKYCPLAVPNALIQRRATTATPPCAELSACWETETRRAPVADDLFAHRVTVWCAR